MIFPEYYDKFSDKVDAAGQEEKVPGLPPHMCCMIFGVGGGISGYFPPPPHMLYDFWCLWH